MLVAALVLRLGVALWPVFHHPDELWQYLEPARHVVGKPWVASWEARAGARGWLVPVLFGGPLWLGQWLAPGTFLAVVLPRLVCVGIAMAGVLGAAGLGFRISRPHGLAVAFVCAIWGETAYFGARTLTEPMATAMILVAACLLHQRSRRSLVVAGLLLGLAGAIRFQYAPAALVLAAWLLKGDARAWTAVVTGGVIGLVASSAADLAVDTTPFAWIVRNVTANLVENRSADYGTSPAWWYAMALWRTWGLAGLPLLALAVIGARRYPELAVAALVNLLVHSLIPHKEARFILLTTTLTVVLAAIGSVDAARRWPAARQPAVFAIAWAALSLAATAWAAQASGWGKYGRLHAAWRSAAEVPGLCGIGIFRTLPLVASHALLARDVPIYQYEDASAAAARRSRAFNVLVTSYAHAGDLDTYRTMSCSGSRPRDLCVRARAGPCVPMAGDGHFAVNSFLARANY